MPKFYWTNRKRFIFRCAMEIISQWKETKVHLAKNNCCANVDVDIEGIMQNHLEKGNANNIWHDYCRHLSWMGDISREKARKDILREVYQEAYKVESLGDLLFWVEKKIK